MALCNISIETDLISEGIETPRFRHIPTLYPIETDLISEGIETPVTERFNELWDSASKLT